MPGGISLNIGIGGAEKEAFEALASEMAEHDRLARDAYDLIGATVTCIPERPVDESPLVTRVAVALLGRLSNDLRCTANLARTGYSLQALTLAASIYEGAFTVSYIGADEELAQQWRDHNDPLQSFRPVRELTIGGLRNLGIEPLQLEQQVEVEYRVYRQLCWAKHLNPVLQTQFGHHLEEDTDSVIFTNGPDTSEESVRAAWFAMQHSVASVGRALVGFTIFHVPDEHHDTLMAKHVDLGQRSKDLERRAKERWGTENPFPERL